MTTSKSADESGWRRFLAQETGAQKFLVALAALVATLGTIIGGGYGLYALVTDDDPPENTPSAGSSPDSPATSGSPDVPPTVQQGSTEADTLVRDLLEHDGGRATLDTFVVAQEVDRNPQYEMWLYYNCMGQAPGQDHCSLAKLSWDSIGERPSIYDNPTRVRFNGVFAVRLMEGDGYGTLLHLYVDKVVT